MSVKRTKFHYTFSKTFSIATIYEDDRIICKDMLIEEKTLDKIIDLLNEQESTITALKKENEQLKIANAKWLDKSLQDKQIRYSNANHKELTKKYLQLKEENEQLRKVCSCLKKENQSLIENIFDIYEKVKWVVR